MDKYDAVIVGTGPAGMGAAFSLLEKKKDISILMIDKAPVSTGGMRNDCKMNFTYPIGFPFEYWDEATADRYLAQVKEFLKPSILPKSNIAVYQSRAEKLGCSLLEIQQTHLGTDGGLRLIQELLKRLQDMGVDISLKEEMLSINGEQKFIETDLREIGYKTILIAPGRHGFHFLQDVMQSLGVRYMDNILDVGVRLETRIEHYPIVKDIRAGCREEQRPRQLRDAEDSPLHRTARLRAEVRRIPRRHGIPHGRRQAADAESRRLQDGQEIEDSHLQRGPL